MHGPRCSSHQLRLPKCIDFVWEVSIRCSEDGRVRQANSQSFKADELCDAAEHHEYGNGEVHHATMHILAQYLKFAQLGVAKLQPRG
jgi:hypothetical protein